MKKLSGVITDAAADSDSAAEKAVGGWAFHIGELLPGITMIIDGLSDHLVAGNDDAGEKLKDSVTFVVYTITEMTTRAVEPISMIAVAILACVPSIISAIGGWHHQRHSDVASSCVGSHHGVGSGIDGASSADHRDWHSASDCIAGNYHGNRESYSENH